MALTPSLLTWISLFSTIENKVFKLTPSHLLGTFPSWYSFFLDACPHQVYGNWKLASFNYKGFNLRCNFSGQRSKWTFANLLDVENNVKMWCLLVKPEGEPFRVVNKHLNHSGRSPILSLSSSKYIVNLILLLAQIHNLQKPTDEASHDSKKQSCLSTNIHLWQ